MNGWPGSGIDIGLGACLGATTAAFYLLGLSVGIRVALRSVHTMPVLICSAALRIALVIAVGSVAVRLGAGAILGFATGFWVVRQIVLATVRRRAARVSAP